MKELNEVKGKKCQRIEKYFWNEKEKLVEIEKAKKDYSRLYLYHQTLMTEPKVFNINCKENFNQENKKLGQKNRKDTGWPTKIYPFFFVDIFKENKYFLFTFR